jgi:hypothetical protein
MRKILLVPLLALVACGRSAPATPATPPPEAVQLRALGSAVARTVETYGARSSSMSDAASCRALRDEHERQVRPALSEIAALAPRLGAWLRARGPTEHADAECLAGAMLAEIERHTDIGCTSLDLAVNRAEAARYSAAMDRWADLAVARGDPTGELREGTGPRCVRFSDGERMYQP